VDAFQDRLARLTELNADELAALEQEMVAAFDAADSAGDVDTMQQLADALDEVRAAAANVETAEAPAEAEAAVAAAADVIEEAPVEEAVAEAIDATETAEAVEEVDATIEEAVDGDVTDLTVAQVAQAAGETAAEAAIADAEKIIEDADAALAEAAAVEPDAAPATTQEETAVAEVTNEDVPVENQPELVTAAAPYVITAGGDIPGVTAGSALDTFEDVVQAMTKKVNAMRGVSGDGERVVVASITRDDYSEDKTLFRNDPVGNSEKIRALVQAGRDGGQEALTAAGWCAPKTPIYDNVNGMAIGVTDTPVLDSMPSVGVDRGGVVWNAPIALSQVDVSKLGHWMRYDDGTFGFAAGVNPATPAGPAASPASDKPCIDIPCPPEQEAELGAIPLCVCTDVLMSRANPEFIRHFTDVLLVAQARFKEQWALAQMAAIATDLGNSALPASGNALGAARDFLVMVRVAASNFRWENRLSPTQSINGYFPSWLRDAMAADLAVQIPGDGTLSVGFSEIAGYFADINVSPIWYLDEPGGADTFDTPKGFATDAAWFLAVPGSAAHLDGGSLDLGVVRTKQDVQQNKFCEFAETFDGFAYMGPVDANKALWLMKGSTKVLIRGGFAPAVGTLTTGVVPGA
jgi:hypothetical protein